MEDRTPNSDDHASCRGWQDAGAISAGPRTISRMTATPDAMPHSVLSTVFDHCTPAIRGKTTTSTLPCSCTPPLLVTIKGGGGLPLTGTFSTFSMFSTLSITTHTRDHRHTLSTTEHSPQPTPLLAETWELPSLSRLACNPYYRHLRCKIIQCPRTPPCWTYGPAAGTRINPCVTVLPLASTSGTRKHATFTSRNPNPRVRTPTIKKLCDS